LKVLDQLEDVEADEKDPEKPREDVVIEKTTVHQNPWIKLEKEYEASLSGVCAAAAAEKTAAVKTNTEKKMEEEEEKKRKMGPKIVGSGIGRFVTGSTANASAKFNNTNDASPRPRDEEDEQQQYKKAKVTSVKKGGFGNFDSW